LLARQAPFASVKEFAMRFSFLTVNYNMAPLVKELIKTLPQQLAPDSSYEMIIADNSTDPDYRLDPAAYPADSPIRIVPVGENERYVTVLNRIMPLAKGDYVVIMHPDVQPKPGCFQTVAAFLDKNPKAGVVSPNLFEASAEQHGIYLRFPSVSTELRRSLNQFLGLFLRRRVLREDVFWDQKEDVQTDMVGGICMVFRNQVLQAIGGIDTRLVSYYYNDYLCARAGQLGWTCHYVRDAELIHLGRNTPKEMFSSQPLMAYKKNSVPAEARTRADYLTFLSLFYPLWARLAFRSLALFNDTLDLLIQFRRPWQRKEKIRHLWRTILVDLGQRPA
jgi:GT2 family glycosyltransferase